MATIHDVAKKAGLSVTTISRVLNNRGYISEQTRQKVYQVMEELNYHPNEIARSLLRKRSHVIGLIVPSVSHPFFGEFASAVEHDAYQQGFKLLLCNSQLDPVKEKEYVEMMRRHRVDGMIVGSHTLDVDAYKDIQYPIITIDREVAEHPFVASDNERGGELAAQLLIDRGCKKIGHICGNLHLHMLSNHRTTGFQRVCEQHDTEYVVFQTDLDAFDQSSYASIIADMFTQHPDLDGVFATSDMMAGLVVKWCMQSGISVPDQLRVVGYDDVGHASWMSPGLSTIRQPIQEMGEQAVRTLIRQMNGESVEQKNILPVELVEREST
ncbi:LacI family DNA-binding transcriptional regulator [Marinicrinis sediminis]|uniref:LacI family DNA-binding transcriptional regulator n=1 Tax=Marinicrinis sediminis TaxID=1652465 RepID=A0ABW5R5D7_9BACL